MQLAEIVNHHVQLKDGWALSKWADQTLITIRSCRCRAVCVPASERVREKDWEGFTMCYRRTSWVKYIKNVFILSIGSTTVMCGGGMV